MRIPFEVKFAAVVFAVCVAFAMLIGQRAPYFTPANLAEQACVTQTMTLHRVEDAPGKSYIGTAYGAAQIQNSTSKYIQCDNGEMIAR